MSVLQLVYQSRFKEIPTSKEILTAINTYCLIDMLKRIIFFEKIQFLRNSKANIHKL